MHDIVHDFAMFLRENDVAVTKESCQFCTPLLVSRVQEYRSLVWPGDWPNHVCDCLASVRVLRVEWSIPSGMKKLIHLRWLELSDGHSISDKNIKIICRLHFLQSLKLSFCFFIEIPLEIGNLVELRHLDLSRNKQLKVLPAEIGNLVELRHLDLSFNFCLEVLPAEIGNLVELRHLDLSRNIKLEVLPESVCNLVELQMLNLMECSSLQGLPEGIHKLQNLQHIVIAYTPVCTRRLPPGLGELSGLRTFQTHMDGRSHFNELRALKKLNSLTGSLTLEIGYTNDAEELVKDAEEADLRSKIHIHKLCIVFMIDQAKGSSSPPLSLWMEVMEALQPNQQKLNELIISGYMASRLPQWISSPLSSLKEISLIYFDELSILPSFRKLPCLEILTLYRIQKLKFLGREFLGIESPPPSPSPSSSLSTKGEEVVSFPKLKKLYIARCNEWSEWEDITAEEEECSAVSILPCLEELHIDGCKSLKMLPNRLLRKASSSLRSLNISDSTLLESQYGDKEGSGWRSITLNNPHLRLFGI